MPLNSDEQKKYLKRLGSYIVALREKKGMKQYELADKLDIDVRVMRRIEKGKTNIQILSILDLAIILDVDASSFLSPNLFEDQTDF